MKKVTTIAALVLAMVMGGVFLALSAEAHTPSGGADCTQGVWAAGNNYESTEINALSVSVDDEAKSVAFATDGYLSMPIPADGLEHTYTWRVDTTSADPAFKASGSGTLTCGDVPTETPTPTPTPSDTPTPTPTTTPTPSEPPTTNPPTDEPATQSWSECVGNALVIHHEEFVDGAWQSTGSDTINGAKRCMPDTPDAPPQVEEGF